MAVYKKSYRGYDGPLTAGSLRFLAPVRFAFEDLKRSRFLTLFFVASMILPLAFGCVIWFNHNLSALALLDIKAERLIRIDVRFFQHFLGIQCLLAFLWTAFVGPAMVAPDLANNALPLYLARPYSRQEYVLSKMTVLLALLSAVTWAPGLLLFGLQAYLEGGGWAGENLRIVYGTVFGSWVYIFVLALLALALSAWVKWKPVAGALLFGVFFVAAGFGAAVNDILNTRWGHLINLTHLIGTVWNSLFEDQAQRGPGAAFFRVRRGEEIPEWSAWLMLAAVCAFCLWMLSRKIRGVEVVR